MKLFFKKPVLTIKQCSRKLPTLYRAFSQAEYEKLSDRQIFCLTEKQSAQFGKIIKGSGCGGEGGGFFFIIIFFFFYNKFSTKI